MTGGEDISDEDSLESGEDDSEETESEFILMGSFGTTGLMVIEHHQSLRHNILKFYLDTLIYQATFCNIMCLEGPLIEHI